MEQVNFCGSVVPELRWKIHDYIYTFVSGIIIALTWFFNVHEYGANNALQHRK